MTSSRTKHSSMALHGRREPYGCHTQTHTTKTKQRSHPLLSFSVRTVSEHEVSFCMGPWVFPRTTPLTFRAEADRRRRASVDAGSIGRLGNQLRPSDTGRASGRAKTGRNGCHCSRPYRGEESVSDTVRARAGWYGQGARVGYSRS